MRYKAIQDGWVMVESSDKMWSTGGGNDKLLQHPCLKNSMNSMKRQKYISLEDELPRLFGLEKSGEITPERMKIITDITLMVSSLT